MAEKWSLDLGSATWQGLMAWVRPGDGLTEIEDSIFELPVGEVGGPIKTAQGYYYVRVDSVYQAPQEPYEDQRDYCKMVLRKRKQTPVYIAFMDSVAQAFNLSYDYGTIDMVIERFKEEGWVQDDEPGRMSRIPEFTAEELAKPVFSFKGGTHYLDEYIESVKDKRVNPAFVLAGREEMERGLRPFVRELLVLYLAYDMEMDKARPVRGHVRQKAMEKGVVEMLVDAAGGEEAAKPTNEDRRRYYEENISRYTQPGAVVISMVTVTDEEVVDDLYDDAKTNWSFSEVVSAYRWVLDEERSSERFRIEDREDNPRVFDVARRMEIGAVSEPIPLSEGGYTVMKLLEKESGAVLPFEEVAEEVTLDLNAEILKNAAAAIEEFKQGLREKYNYRVNKEAFEAVNL
jgi:hypothetical protein